MLLSRLLLRYQRLGARGMVRRAGRYTVKSFVHGEWGGPRDGLRGDICCFAVLCQRDSWEAGLLLRSCGVALADSTWKVSNAAASLCSLHLL